MHRQYTTHRWLLLAAVETVCQTISIGTEELLTVALLAQWISARHRYLIVFNSDEYPRPNVIDDLLSQGLRAPTLLFKVVRREPGSVG